MKTKVVNQSDFSLDPGLLSFCAVLNGPIKVTETLLLFTVGGFLQLAMPAHISFAFTAHSTTLAPRFNILLHTRPIELTLH